MKEVPSADVRRVVWLLLSGAEEFPSRALDVAVADADFDPRDRALAKELLAGVLRSRLTLDCIGQAFATRRVRDPNLLLALALGLYQLLFLDRIPHHAAIDATLTAVKPELGGEIGFLNAVLRAVARSAVKTKQDLAPARDHLPHPPWQFGRKVFCDPQRDAIGHLAETRGYPRFLIQRWWERVGEERTRERAQALNHKAALWLRVNPLRSGVDEVQSALAEAGIDAVVEQEPGMLRVVAQQESAPIDLWPGFAEGRWSVQDLSSLQSLALAQPRKGERILDLCAAPGGKSFAAFEAVGGEAEILACDLSATRLQTLEKEAARLGHQIETLVLDPEGGNLPPGPWDLVLCDVPCSNTGVLNKRPEARARFSKQALHKMVTLQNLLRKRLLLPVLEDHTRILWTTCSLEDEENQEAAARLAKASSRELVAERLFEPSSHRAGGYSALVVAPA